jgi:hypothetical protein
MKRKQRINHRRNGHQRKQARADLANAVTEVEKPDCETAQDDGEVEP